MERRQAHALLVMAICQSWVRWSEGLTIPAHFRCRRATSDFSAFQCSFPNPASAFPFRASFPNKHFALLPCCSCPWSNVHDPTEGYLLTFPAEVYADLIHGDFPPSFVNAY
jgi:hypothetical protein